MDETLRAQRDASLALVNRLIRRGRELSAGLNAVSERAAHAHLAGSAQFAETPVDVRLWQQECATAINELSGGSKAHWLARAFSAAFLVPSTAASVIVEADVIEIVDRLLDVLLKAGASLEGMVDIARGEVPPARRFDFVHNADLRPVLEQAYRDAGRMLEQGSYQLALFTSCGVLEAILTDALEHRRQPRAGVAQECGSDEGNIADWSFETRIVRAEQAGLIRGGCARLPRIARLYRNREEMDGESGTGVQVTERDARLARQVLHVIMRDLDPGR